MTRLAIIHTTPATIDPLKALAQELMPGVDVINFVDDSILPQLAENGGDVSAVEERLVAYARFAEEVGADIILEACSSVGEVVDRMRAAVDIPVVRIDTAMAREAVRRGELIGVAATLSTTLRPTTRLIRETAELMGKDVEVQPLLVEGAFERLVEGDRDAHDRLVADALRSLARSTDIVVLAQASMAGVVSRLPAELQKRFLTSPRSGMELVRDISETTDGE
ncbi:MAG: aspartate/glutamate racemase family protein [Anaerolineae bacterium]